MLYAGLDLSRRKLDVHVLDEDGATVEALAVHPDADALRTLAERFPGPVTATIESMNGARFVHDELQGHGWDVLIADAARVKGLAPLAAKTDEIDARVLAILAWRDLVPAVWLVHPAIRAERERARYRLYLVRHRTSIKNRVHATLFAFGHSVPATDLFGVRGRELLAALEVPEPWDRTLAASLARLDALEAEIRGCEAELARLGADHEYVPLLADGAGGRAHPRLHHRRGDRRHRPLRERQAARGLHRALSPGLPVGRDRPAREAGQDRPEVPALGARRGRGPRGEPSTLSEEVPTHQAPARQAAGQWGGTGGAGARAGHRHLVHAHAPGAVPSGRPPS